MNAGEIRMDDLFRTVTRIDFMARELYLRALSDFDLNAREEYALYKASFLRKEMQTTGTKENLMYLQWLEEASDASLKQIILLSSSQMFWSQSYSEIEQVLIPIPEDATDEERENTIELRRAELERVGKARQEFVKNKFEALEKELDAEDFDKLRKRARSAQIDFQMRFTRQAALDSYTLWACVFRDEKCQTRYFENPEQAGEMETTVRQTLVGEYYRNMQRISELDLKYFLLTGVSTDSLPHSKDAAKAEVS